VLQLVPTLKTVLLPSASSSVKLAGPAPAAVPAVSDGDLVVVDVGGWVECGPHKGPEGVGRLTNHLGYEHGDVSGHRSGNSRNGSYPTTVTTEIGEVALQIPRNRNGTFEPATIPKYVRRLDGLSGNVISLYAKGLTTGEISNHLFDMYGTEVSKDTISRITDGVLVDMTAWQNRPLDAKYPVLLIDAIVIKVRGTQVANRPVYVAIGVNLDVSVTSWACGWGLPAGKAPSSG
jgi:putative transposase